jgi:hypothetical protein
MAETRVPAVMPVPETTMPTTTLPKMDEPVTAVPALMVQEAITRLASNAVLVTVPTQRP